MPRLEHTGTQLERRRASRHTANARRQRTTEIPVFVGRRGPSFLEHLDGAVHAPPTRPLHDVEESRALVVEILVGVRAAIQRERDVVRHDVEVVSPRHLAAEQEHGPPRRVGSDVEARPALRHLHLQRREHFGHGEHAAECVDAAKVKADVCRLSAHDHAHRDHAAVRVPHDATRRLHREHPDRVALDAAGPNECDRATRPRRLLIRHRHGDHATRGLESRLGQRANRERHRGDSALHVGRAAAVEVGLSHHRLEL
jgi:hypothetical protein